MKEDFSNTKLRGIKVLIGALVALQLFFFVNNFFNKTTSNLLGVDTLHASNCVDSIFANDTIKKSASIFGFKDTVKKRPPFICNLNTADSTTLVKLYGIGGYYAKKIIKYREALGGSFVVKEQLMEIDGFGQERFDNIKEKLIIRSSDIKLFNFESVDIKFLEKHPYIGPYAARGIIKYIELRRKNGDSTFVKPAELAVNNIITNTNALRLEFYMLSK